MRVRLRLERTICCVRQLLLSRAEKVCVAAVRVRRVELRLDSERYERKRIVCVTCSAKCSFASLVLPPLSAGNRGSLGDIRVVNAVAR